MRLADFIEQNEEKVLVEWEKFARGVWPEGVKLLLVRDHAEEILRATVLDMRSTQSTAQQSEKAKGRRAGEALSHVDAAAVLHVGERINSGFDLLAIVAEYRALRASVISLWQATEPPPDLKDMRDITRFNEAIDQSLIAAVSNFTSRVERSKQMFLAILGHDLRNPLNTVAMASQFLVGRQPGGDAAELGMQISESVEVMRGLIHDLLDFAAGTLGDGMPITPVEADLKSLSESAIQEIKRAHPDRDFSLTTDGDTKGSWDAPRLRQVLSNLLGNAVRYGTPGKQIEIAIIGEADRVRLVIKNYGEPIPADQLPWIFDPLMRGSPESFSGGAHGSLGLGLYIVRQIVHAHGGSIGASSSADEGTVFTVDLPRRPIHSP